MKSRAVGRGVSEWLLLGRSVVAEFSSAHFARRNVHRPGEEFTGWKSNPVKEKIASRKDDRDAHNTLRQGRLSLLRQARGGGENESEDPRVTPTRGAPKFMFRTYVWATRRFQDWGLVGLTAARPAGSGEGQRPCIGYSRYGKSYMVLPRVPLYCPVNETSALPDETS